MKKVNYLLILLLIFSFLAVFFNLGKRELSEDISPKVPFLKSIMRYNWQDVHEARYAEISRNIADSNDWFTLKWEERSYYNKGPIYFWLSALFIKIFGFSAFAARFWSAVFGFGSIVFTYFLAREVFDKKTALWAMLLMATSLQFVISAREGTLDVAMIFFGLSSFYFYLRHLDSRKNFLFYLAVFLLAILGLVKSVFIAIPVVLFYFFFDIKRVANIKSVVRWVIGLLILGVFILSWVGVQAYLYKQNRRDNISFSQIFLDAQMRKSFFNSATTHEITKYSGGKKYAVFSPFYDKEEVFNALYYPKNIFKAFFPWSIFIILGVFHGIYLAYSDKSRKLLTVLLFMAMIMVFLAVSFEKIFRWAVILYPFFSVLIAKTINDLIGLNFSKLLKWGFLCTLIVSSSLLLPYKIPWFFNLIMYVLLVGLIAAYFFSKNEKNKKLSISLIMGHFAAIGFIHIINLVFAY